MMGLTHAVSGVAVAFPLAVLYPELALPIALAGYLGGFLPDLDLLVGTHRQTLHFPVAFSIASVVLVGGVVGFGSAGVVIGAATVLGAALHSVMDIFGAGVEERPWERTDTQAVYNHFTETWITAKYWIPYDGSPHDLALLGIVAGVVSVSYRIPELTQLLGATVGIGVVYTVVRKRLPTVKTYIESRLGFYPWFFP